MSSDSAVLVPTQQSVKAYVDAQVTAQDLDFQGDSGGALSIDLDSEIMTIAGGTGINTSGSGNTLTISVDNSVSTITGSDTLTNKNIDADNNTISNLEVDNFKAAAIVIESEGIGSNDNDTTLPTSAAVKDYVDSQTTAQDLDFQADSGGALSIDLDSETMTFTGGTGIDTSGSGNTVTFDIDSTVATLTGTQTLTNKTLTSPDVNTPDIDGGTIDGTVIGGTTAAAGSFTTVSATGNITVDGTVDGRDVATDGTKLDGIEALADVTDTTNVTAAGAVMDSELTNETAVKSLDQGVATTDTPSFTGLTTTADVSFGDNDKAIFGAGSDLQIYHDGSASYIDDAGTGNLRIRANSSLSIQKYTGETMGVFTADGSVLLAHDNNTKFETTSTGIDVTGTVTADGLTVDGTVDVNFGSDGSPIASLSGASAGRKLDIQSFAVGASAGAGYSINATSGVGELDFQTGGVSRLNIDFGGDISFFEDTGTTAKLFWDASAESLGIGTSSPSTTLDVEGNITLSGSNGKIYLPQTPNTFNWIGDEIEQTGIVIVPTNDGTSERITFAVDNAERMRINSSGKVGIGASSVNGKLDIKTSNAGFEFYPENSTDTNLIINYDRSASSYQNLQTRAATHQFLIGASEAMRIDSSGNLLVGGTSAYAASTITMTQDGILYARRSGGSPATFRRDSDDGSIVTLEKDGSTVGSIGTANGNAFILSNDVGLTFAGGNDAIFPTTSAGAYRDAAIDLGGSGQRFKDLYLSGGAYLGGTGSANKLDDYEEGTYDVTITPSTSGTVTLNTSFNRAQYTKVGRMVHVSGLVIVSSVSSPVGYFTINLPFTVVNLTDRAADASASVTMQAVVSANVSDFVGTVNEGGQGLFVQLGDGTSLQSDSAQQLQASTNIYFSATYAAA